VPIEEGVVSSDLARVAVIAGGLSNEREVSWRSGRRAQYALGQAGVDATLYDADESLLDRLKADRVEAAYVAVHGASG
jgi:D-alanine-D-alanine ligase